MFSIKRSAAALGVVGAGLLAAAGPASAQLVDGTVLAKAGPQTKAGAGGISAKELADAVNAPASPTSEVFTSVSNVAPLHGDATTIVPRETVSFTFKGEVIGLEPNALGTQVGSEGVKANNLRGEAIDIIP